MAESTFAQRQPVRRRRRARPAERGALQQRRERLEASRPRATSSIVPTSTRFMWRMNVSASIQNSSSSPSRRATRRATHVALEAHVVGLGRREGGEVVRAEQRRGARVQQRRGRARCGHHSARPRSNDAARAPREHAVAVGARASRRGGRRSRRRDRLAREHGDVGAAAARSSRSSGAGAPS